MTDRELMQQALDCLLAWEEESSGYGWSISDQECVEALRARLAQPEPEPVAMLERDPSIGRLRVTYEDAVTELDEGVYPLYTAPPQREWQGMTENEIKHLWYEACQTNLELTSQLIVHLARNIEAKLKEKNT